MALPFTSSIHLYMIVYKGKLHLPIEKAEDLQKDYIERMLHKENK